MIEKQKTNSDVALFWNEYCQRWSDPDDGGDAVKFAELDNLQQWRVEKSTAFKYWLLMKSIKRNHVFGKSELEEMEAFQRFLCHL